MSCIFSDVSGHSGKSVSAAQEQVLPRPSSVEGDQGGSAAAPQNDRQEEAIIPQREESVDEVLSIPETQSDRLSFPNLQGTAKEEQDEKEEQEEEEGEEEEDDDDEEEDEEEEQEEEEGEEEEDDDDEEEDDDDDGNGMEGSQDDGDDGDEGEEDGRREDAEMEQEVQEHPPLEGGAPSKEVRFLSPLPLLSTQFLLLMRMMFITNSFSAFSLPP